MRCDQTRIDRRSEQHHARDAVIAARAQVREARRLGSAGGVFFASEDVDPVAERAPGVVPAIEVSLSDASCRLQALAYLGATVSGRSEHAQQLGIEQLVLEKNVRHPARSVAAEPGVLRYRENGRASMTDELERLDRLLGQLAQLLEIPGDDGASSPERSWQKLDVMYRSMGPDALGAVLRRQGMGGPAIDDALMVLDRRARMMP
jgi:hypothetical protein